MARARPRLTEVVARAPVKHNSVHWGRLRVSIHCLAARSRSQLLVAAMAPRA